MTPQITMAAPEVNYRPQESKIGSSEPPCTQEPKPYGGARLPK